MPISERLLNDGEQVVIDVRPHWSFVFGPILAAVVVSAGTIALFSVTAVPAWAEILLLVLIGAALLRLGGRYARWTTTNFVVTDQRAIYATGVLARRSREIPLFRLTDTAVSQSIGQRLIGAGKLVIESGGEWGQDALPQIACPRGVQRELNRLIDLDRRRYGPMAGREMSVPEQIEKLDELCRRGVITPDEFTAKKADLLDRM